MSFIIRHELFFLQKARVHEMRSAGVRKRNQQREELYSQSQSWSVCAHVWTRKEGQKEKGEGSEGGRGGSKGWLQCGGGVYAND